MEVATTVAKARDFLDKIGGGRYPNNFLMQGIQKLASTSTRLPGTIIPVEGYLTSETTVIVLKAIDWLVFFNPKRLGQLNVFSIGIARAVPQKSVSRVESDGSTLAKTFVYYCTCTSTVLVKLVNFATMDPLIL
jgi:hypothetical protein